MVAIVRLSRVAGFWGARPACRLVARGFGTHIVRVETRSGFLLNLRLNDSYWIRLLSPHFDYEPELEVALRREVDSNTVFLDGGANIGYWSLFMADRALLVVSVEASPRTFGYLTQNVSLNRAEVTAVNAAITERSSDSVALREKASRHDSNTIYPRDDKSLAHGWSDVKVPAMSLGDILERYCLPYSSRVVVKLDIEGAEVPALRSAIALLRANDTVIFYEDHGNDPTHSVSVFLTENGFTLFDPVTRQELLLPEIARIKVDRYRGYNFGAARRTASEVVTSQCL